MELVGVAKSNSSVDYAMLEYCIRDDLKPKAPRVMAVCLGGCSYSNS